VPIQVRVEVPALNRVGKSNSTGNDKAAVASGSGSHDEEFDDRMFKQAWVPSNLHQVSDFQQMDRDMNKLGTGKAKMSDFLCAPLLAPSVFQQLDQSDDEDEDEEEDEEENEKEGGEKDVVEEENQPTSVAPVKSKKETLLKDDDNEDDAGSSVHSDSDSDSDREASQRSSSMRSSSAGGRSNATSGTPARGRSKGSAAGSVTTAAPVESPAAPAPAPVLELPGVVTARSSPARSCSTRSRNRSFEGGIPLCPASAKEAQKLHKIRIKEEKREKRAEKIPKCLKKRQIKAK